MRTFPHKVIMKTNARRTHIVKTVMLIESLKANNEGFNFLIINIGKQTDIRPTTTPEV